MSDQLAGTNPNAGGPNPLAPRPEFSPGESVPGLSSWVLVRKLGGGGFGEVWLAEHALRKEKPRAVKFCFDPALKTRLVTHEKNVVARVMKYAGDHPNIVPLLEFNLDGDIPWLMYEYVEGGTLASFISQWRDLPFPKRLGRAVRTLHGVASALATCHRLVPPLVHRDMKPQNILMAGNVPRITDFGIGSVVTAEDTNGQTVAGALLPSVLNRSGTRNYAPIEQLYGSPPHPREDVFALGMIAYQLVMGDPRTAPGSDATQELTDLRVPKELTSLIVRSVAVRPDRRPMDANEWETVLAKLLEKARKQPEPVETTIAGSEVVPIPDLNPTKANVELVDPVPPSDPQPGLNPLEFPAEPGPVIKPARGNAVPQSWVKLYAAIALGSLMLLVFTIAIVIAVWPSGKSTEPTSSSATQEPKSDEGNNRPKGGDECEIEIASGVKMQFCWIPKGACQLGSSNEEQDYITKKFYDGKRPSWLDDETEMKRGTFRTDGFWMGKYEVMQKEWKVVMGDNPSSFNGEHDNRAKGMDTSKFPVETVSWDRICGRGKFVGEGFLSRVNEYGGKALGQKGKFKLPTENEWEYACRGGRGNKRAFYWGNAINGTQANCDGTKPYGTTSEGTYLERTCVEDAVDDTLDNRYEGHPWGLMHMHGNVWEWCADVDGKITQRVLCGGAWVTFARNCRASDRLNCASDTSTNYCGFRLVFRLD